MRILAFIVIFIYVTYTKKFKMVLYMIWFSMMISSIIAAFSDPVEEWTFRKSGGTEDPNDFAAQILGVIFITYYLFKENRNWLFLIVSLPLFFYTLLYAGSKSSFIFLALISILIFIVRFRDIMNSIFTLKGLLASMFIVLLVSGGLFLMSGSSAVKGLEHRSSKTGTLQQRLIVWRAGSEMIRDNFFLGVGFAQFPKVSKNYLKDWLPDEALPSHNNFIKVFAESGVFSFLAFVIFIISLFTTRVREIFGSNYFWIYIASLSVVLMGLTIPSMHHKDYWFMISLISAVIYHIEYKDDLEYET
jgi:O-antigen ligase